jgi:peptide/nickel transport system permease protein
VVRTVRQSAIDVSRQLYVEAAIARGIRPSWITLRHVLPNCLLPVVTLLGINFGALIGGSVVVEAVFALPGIGTEIVRAVAVRDYPVIQGVAIVCALFVVVSNLIVDALYILIDPRTRRG